MTITMYICTREDTVMSFIMASFDTFESTGLFAELVCCEGKQRCGSRLGWFINWFSNRDDFLSLKQLDRSLRLKANVMSCNENMTII